MLIFCSRKLRIHLGLIHRFYGYFKITILLEENYSYFVDKIKQNTNILNFNIYLHDKYFNKKNTKKQKKMVILMERSYAHKLKSL